MAAGGLPGAHAPAPAGKPRARSLGIPFGGTPGRWNAITDVPGVQVGYTALVRGDSVRTGVTAIHPRGPGGAADPVAAGFFSQNGNGEMTGVSWICESGSFSGPIAITNTHAVGITHAAIVAWIVKHHPQLGDDWSLPVAGETWDGYLNDINAHHVTEEAAMAALESAASVAADAPLLPHQGTAMARRVTLGLARPGTTGSHFSGDLFLAFSTANPGGFSPYDPDTADGAGQRYDRLTFVPWSAMNPLFAA